MTIKFYSEIVSDQQFSTMLDGIAYRWFCFGDIPAESSKHILIHTSPEKATLFFGRALEGHGANGTLEVFVNPTYVDTGVPCQNIFNMNGLSTTVAEGQVFEDAVITEDGVLSDYDQFFGSPSTGSGNKGSLGSVTSQEFPRIMPKDAWIHVKITNLSTTNPLSIAYKLFWSEITE